MKKLVLSILIVGCLFSNVHAGFFSGVASSMTANALNSNTGSSSSSSNQYEKYIKFDKNGKLSHESKMKVINLRGDTQASNLTGKLRKMNESGMYTSEWELYAKSLANIDINTVSNKILWIERYLKSDTNSGYKVAAWAYAKNEQLDVATYLLEHKIIPISMQLDTFEVAKEEIMKLDNYIKEHQVNYILYVGIFLLLFISVAIVLFIKRKKQSKKD